MQDQAEGEDIGARVGFPALELFRRHVLDRADDQALCGERSCSGTLRLPEVLRARLIYLRQPEIQQLGAGLGEHDITRLEIAVNHAVPMGLIQRVCDLNA